MKKLLLMVACALTSMVGMATETKTYTDQLEVSINGESTTQQTAVSVEMLEDNYINFALNNFILANGDDKLYVGNIQISNLFLKDKGEYKSFSYNANLQIKAGDMEGVDEDSWLGPKLGNVPLVLSGKITDDKIYVSIDIDMQSSLGQTIYVKFGSDTFTAPTVTLSKEYTDARTAYGVTNFGENKGTVMNFDSDASSKTAIETLSNNEINFVINNMPLGMSGQTMSLGDLAIKNLEIQARNGYVSFGDSCSVTFSGNGQFAGMTVPAIFEGKYSDTQLYYTLKLIVDAMQMDMYFTFGTDFAPVTVSGDAKKYADKLVVTVNDESTDPMDANVEVEPLTNGGINFVLKNFTMELSGNKMHVGNIEIKDLPLYEGLGYKYFNYNGNLTIAAGDEAGVDSTEWIGPMLGDIPLRLRGRMNDNKLYVTIDIDMESLGQIIYVTFGSEVEPDGINAISTDETGKIYDLAGRQVSKATKGIYIINGKKILK